ncbi:hypothetical protein EGW08_018968 [Elysia chlorotica]|uniref:Major facilitator superfamily (MFS) profile domain-containing protein n=1 Tax=Elysia chlorotica TaxID=188477 RepID=A0A3S1B2A0_ELYCH|nr:hypothetical protein EGW08_018968 [Elysia chlorotica]
MVITSEDCRGGDQVSVDGSMTSGSFLGGSSGPGTAYDTVTSLEAATGDKNHSANHNLIRNLSIERQDIGSAHDLTANQSDDKDVSEEKEDETLAPPDGGYAWFVVLGSFLSHVLIGGLERSDGIFFLLFESKFKMGAALTAWPGAVASMMRLAMGPIASAICERWSVRACCMVGGLALGLVQMLSSFSENFYFLFVSHGFLQGISRGLLYCPSLILVNMYFEKRRSLATGLAASGVGVGTLVVVPLIQFLFDTYGFSGGYIVLSAICFNGMLFAMLYRPLFLHYKFAGKKGPVIKKPTPSEAVMLSEMSDAADTTSLRSVRLGSSLSIHRDPELAQEVTHGLIPQRLGVKSPSGKTQMILSSHSLGLRPRAKPNHSSCCKSTFELLFPRENSHKSSSEKNGQKTKLFHFELLRNPAFLGFCLSIGIFTATFKSTFTFIPALAKSFGLTNTEAVMVLSLSGMVDTIGRVVAGFVLDRPWVRSRRLAVYGCVQFVIAGLCALMPLVGTSFIWLCIICSLFGMLTGIVVSQKSVLCVDLLSAKLMPSAFGILLLFQAGGIGIGPILAGACRDFFGRFHEAFFLGAGLMALSACLMIYSTIVHTVRVLEATFNTAGVLEATFNTAGVLEATFNTAGVLEATFNTTGVLEATFNTTGVLEATLNTAGLNRLQPMLKVMDSSGTDASFLLTLRSSVLDSFGNIPDTEDQLRIFS